MKKIAIVLGTFHQDLVTKMLEQARKTAKEAKLTIVTEVWVPGSLEKPLMIKSLLAKNDIDAVVVLGIIERGETKHGLVMGMAVISSLIQLELEYMKPIGIGILGPEILPEQIAPRLKPYAKDAVLAVKTMVTLLDKKQ